MKLDLINKDKANKNKARNFGLFAFNGVLIYLALKLTLTGGSRPGNESSPSLFERYDVPDLYYSIVWITVACFFIFSLWKYLFWASNGKMEIFDESIKFKGNEVGIKELKNVQILLKKSNADNYDFNEIIIDDKQHFFYLDFSTELKSFMEIVEKWKKLNSNIEIKTKPNKT